MTRSRPRSTRVLLVGVMTALVVILVAAGWAVGEDHRDETADRDVALLLARTTPPLQAAVDEAATAASSSSAAVVDLDDVPEGLEAVAVLARDAGSALLGPPLQGAEGVEVVVLSPRYRDPAPRTTAERRAQLEGFVLSPVAVSEALADLDGTVTVSDGQIALASTGDPEGSTARAVERIEVLRREWTVEAAVAVPFPAATTIGVIVGVALLLAAAGVLWRWQSQFESGDEALDAARREGFVLTEMAAVLQASLDLSDVCPAFATMLFQQLPVDGASIELIREDGTVRTLFALGAATAPDAVPVVDLPGEVPGGSTLALAMERDRRLRGVLRLHTTGAFTDSDRRIAVVAAQLAGAAIDNATAHARQRDALRRLGELDELKTVFLGTAAHELRTPVTAITGFSTMLRDRGDELTDEQRTLLVSRLAENSARLRLLVEDLLDLSRLDSGRMVEANERIDLGRLVFDVVSDLGPLLTDRQLDLSVDAGVVVDADRAALERIVSNLVSNAAKFSPAGSTITVRVTPPAPGAGQCRLVVEDEGPGVPESERVRIFSRFYRGKGEEVVRTRGTGIGLSVVLELVRMLGGSVSVEEGRVGARFVVELPIAEVSAGAPSA